MKKIDKDHLVEKGDLNELVIRLRHELTIAKETIHLLKTGKIDAFVTKSKNNFKIYTENSYDKTYRVLIEEMNEGAVTLNRDGVILYCNSCFATLVKEPLQKVPGKKLRDFIDHSSKLNFDILIKLARKNTAREEIKLVGSTNKMVPVLMSVNTLIIHEKLILSIIVTDLTIPNRNQEELSKRAKQVEQTNIQLKSANEKLALQNLEKEKREAELRIANKELAFQNDEKEKQAAELSCANEELTAFTYITSHDLQEPLRKIQTIVGMILEEEEKNLSDKGKGYFQRLKNTAARMRMLINDLLKYSQAKSREQHFENSDLNSIINEVIANLEDTIKEKKAIIDVKPLGIACIIPFQFKQLFYNLIGNSLKFVVPGIAPRISIQSKRLTSAESEYPLLVPEKKYLNLSIIDNGIGFDPQFKDRIFEVFQRLHSSEEYDGTGIGLALSKRIVENHHGFITAKGTLNKGTRVDIYLPV